LPPKLLAFITIPEAYASSNKLFIPKLIVAFIFSILKLLKSLKFIVEYFLLKRVFPSFIGVSPTPLIDSIEVSLLILNFKLLVNVYEGTPVNKLPE
jgi:hypothetical protein